MLDSLYARIRYIPYDHTERPMKKALCAVLVLFSGTACSTIDCGTREENFNRETRRGDRLAFVNIADEDGTPYSLNLNRDKSRRGYAIQAPIHRTGDAIPVNFTVSRTKEYRWFSGLQLSFNF